MPHGGINVAAEAAGASAGGLATERPANTMRDVVADIITALEDAGLGGVWALFAEKPDAVVLRREGGYEVKLLGKFVRVTVTTDEEFNVKHVDVEL